MYFVTFIYEDKESIGIWDKADNIIFPMDKIFSKMGKKLPETMNDFIKASSCEMIEEMKAIIDRRDTEAIPIGAVKLMAPIPNPERDIICLGLNYLDHAKEIKGIPGAESNIPKFPVYFNKRAHPAIGDKAIIKKHEDITHELDYEIELAIIIQKDGINIMEKDVEEYIFGYTIVNDISARDVQRNHTQWFKGKSLDTHCAMGPCIVHKSKLKTPIELDIISKVNGEIRQSSNTEKFIFNIPYIISDLSKGMKLLAGDIIITGTPAGVGLGFDPPKFLKSKDTVECCIENIGTLTNYIE